MSALFMTITGQQPDLFQFLYWINQEVATDKCLTYCPIFTWPRVKETRPIDHLTSLPSNTITRAEKEFVYEDSKMLPVTWAENYELKPLLPCYNHKSYFSSLTTVLVQVPERKLRNFSLQARPLLTMYNYVVGQSWFQVNFYFTYQY